MPRSMINTQSEAKDTHKKLQDTVTKEISSRKICEDKISEGKVYLLQHTAGGRAPCH